MPPFYGDAVLSLVAYDSDIKPKELKRYMKIGWANELAIANYYVKRDLFFPIFARKYSYYQCHQPGDTFWQDGEAAQEEASTGNITERSHTLRNVTVKARRRRGLRAIDYSKPAFVLDTHELYNLSVDYGMLHGFYQLRNFPQAIARLLLGTAYSYGIYQHFNIRGLIDGYTFYRDFYSERYLLNDPDNNPLRSTVQINQSLTLKRQDEIRVYTDLEPRNPDLPRTRAGMQADVTLNFKPFPDEGFRHTYRDRHIILHGYYIPNDFYHRDYSHKPRPTEVQDYRRTLYWNPNAKLDADGRFTATFYNNGKPTRMKVSAVGLTDEGQPVYCNK